ncbi:hypothetical protein BV898_04757 [Hypsibius exemplaris]|uniref:Uncharacterized protein n=1 Tax=Hypsibius exemplaris TaxID=2072580 RepID=A0A1W0X1F1_HYPEX|nr:hypothetical protein BV898_04757 [Hypsibius exemplaris]
MACRWGLLAWSVSIVAVLVLLVGSSTAQQNEVNLRKSQLGAAVGGENLLSSAFWRNTKPGDFERLFVPSGVQFDQLSAAAQKKAWYRMFKKAIAARGSARYLLKNGDPMSQA